MTNTLEYAHRELEALSGGQRQRVWLAMALAQETDILLLDEPTTYLDMAHQLEVLEIVKQLNDQLNCTIVMVLHDLNHAARYSDEMIAMKNGTIISHGPPQHIILLTYYSKFLMLKLKLCMTAKYLFVFHMNS